MLRCPKCGGLAVVSRGGGPHFDGDALCQTCMHAWEPEAKDTVNFVKLVEKSLGIRYYEIEEFADRYKQMLDWMQKEAKSNPAIGLDLSPGDGDYKTRDRILASIKRADRRDRRRK